MELVSIGPGETERFIFTFEELAKARELGEELQGVLNKGHQGLKNGGDERNKGNAGEA